jgi:hypothetical protein
LAGKDEQPAPPGWYRQHDDPGTLRWWDGTDWTDDTMTAPSEDAPVELPAPLSAGPSPEPAVVPIVADAGEDAVTPAAPRRRSASGATAARRGRGTATTTGRGRGTGAPAGDDGGAGALPGTAGSAPARGSTSARNSGANGPRSHRTAAAAQDPAAPRAARAATSAAAGPRPRPGPARPPQRLTGANTGRRPDPSAAARGAHSDRVVRRRPAGPGPGVRVALRALLLAAVVGVLYLGYAQLRDAEPPDARTLTAEPTAPSDGTFGPVAEALLTLDDLPAGWVAQAHDPGVDDVCHGRVPRSVIAPVDVASAAFTQAASGPFLTGTVSRFEDVDTARAFMDLTERVVESCRTYEADGTTVRLGPLDYPRFGDDTFVAAVSGDSQFGPVSGRLVHVRVGRFVASVETIAFGDATVSDELVEHLSNLLSKRLRRL